MSEPLQDGTRQEMDTSAPGTEAALTPRVGGPEGCGDGKSHAGPDESSGAEGWQLGYESWSFHRQFHGRVGRPARNGEFTFIRDQIRRRTAQPLGGRFYRVTLPDGTPLVVEGGWNRLTGAEAADWMPPAKASPRVAQSALRPPPPAEPVHHPKPAPRQPLRASTLTLGNPGAARVLAERLRRFGLPEHAISQPAPP